MRIKMTDNEIIGLEVFKKTQEGEKYKYRFACYYKLWFVDGVLCYQKSEVGNELLKTKEAGWLGT